MPALMAAAELGDPNREVGRRFGDRDAFVLGGVVGDHNHGRVHGLRGERMQAALQHVGAIEGDDHDGDACRVVPPSAVLLTFAHFVSLSDSP
jgi:hypothetical protein